MVACVRPVPVRHMCLFIPPGPINTAPLHIRNNTTQHNTTQHDTLEQKTKGDHEVVVCDVAAWRDAGAAAGFEPLYTDYLRRSGFL